MDLSIRFLILVLSGLVLGGSAQALSADDLLNQQEANLLELVNRVQTNARNSCELLSTCSAESTCSRLSCPLTNASSAGYKCQAVLPNTNCKGNCSSRNFDFSRSVVRVPRVNATTINSTTQRQLQEICTHRNLDNLFNKYSNNTNFFRLYFGSVDGTFRIFPGTDESDCGSYDPRTRLWYLTSALNVKKAVMVLIDRGDSMTDTIKTTRNDSNFATACNTTLSFLNTTTQGDYVNIITFDKRNVQVTDTSSHPDFKNFTATLSSPDKSSVPVGSISYAIDQVITSSAGFSNTNISSDYLKVIILITDSKTVGTISNDALPWDLIKNNNISLFLYMFPPYIDATRLKSQLCAAQGYFKILDDTIDQNPLLALEAYYSFVANVHWKYVNSGIDYSIEYSDYSKVDNQTFTLSKAVFRLSNGEFLGVAAINIFKTKLKNDYGIEEDEIKGAISKKENQTNTITAPTGINITTCLDQTSNGTCNQTANISNIICSSNFDADITTLRKLSCCNCTAAGETPDLPLALGLGFGLGIPALTTLAVIAWFRWRNQSSEPDEFPGEDEDDVRQ